MKQVFLQTRYPSCGPNQWNQKCCRSCIKMFTTRHLKMVNCKVFISRVLKKLAQHIFNSVSKFLFNVPSILLSWAKRDCVPVRQSLGTTGAQPTVTKHWRQPNDQRSTN